MRKNTSWMFVAILFLCGTMSVAAQTKGKKHNSLYFTRGEQPNPCVYLPAPPDVVSVDFMDDYNQWLWGKSVRNTPRGKQASWESLYGMTRMATVFGEAMGMTISKEATPAIWHFMHRVGETGQASTEKAKIKYMRRRPFDRMNEHVWGEFDNENDLRHNGSYPSGHTGLGWSTALALAELAPELQDTILRRGFEYGQSRVIVGAHWQSDVDAGRLTASASVALMHTSPEFQEDFEAAREEYMRIKGIKKRKTIEAGYPIGKKVLDAPVDTVSRRFQGDAFRYWLAKEERNTERGREAVQDTACSEQAFLNSFTPCLGVALDAETTPATNALIAKVFTELCTVCTEVKSEGFRKRPFVQFGEQTPLPEKEESYTASSSYPSSHALLGWGIALTLVEVMPDFQDAILARGFEYGRSRVILGFHYASDVQAGRVVAACALARMHNDAQFQKMMAAAKKEYAKLKSKGKVSVEEVR